MGSQWSCLRRSVDVSKHDDANDDIQSMLQAEVSECVSSFLTAHKRPFSALNVLSKNNYVEKITKIDKNNYKPESKCR